MSYEDAINTGAKAFFEDTYPEIVRVVKISNECHPELVSGSKNMIDAEMNSA
jgi:alanyl-tRNA synthetase